MDFVITKFGLEQAGAIQSIETFSQAVQEATDMSNGSAWALGDLMDLARGRADEYVQAFDMHKKSLRTLQNYALVAQAFPPQRRTYDVSFSHYAAVRTLPPLLQDEMLRQAVKYQWNRDELRTAIQKLKRQPERKTIIAAIGLIDSTLQSDYGLALGTEVRVTFEIVAVQVEPEQERQSA